MNDGPKLNYERQTPVAHLRASDYVLATVSAILTFILALFLLGIVFLLFFGGMEGIVPVVANIVGFVLALAAGASSFRGTLKGRRRARERAVR